jgi:NADH:ubiquinone oxidoreductase subunit 2 (subunit N)
MISLMGIAPFPGFIGQLFAFESFVECENYFIVFIALISLIILMSAYLQIIRSMYFNQKDVEFNRPDYGLYIYLLINIILIVLLVVKPNIWPDNMITVFNLVLV